MFLKVVFFSGPTLMCVLYQDFLQNQTSHALEAYRLKWLKTSLFGSRIQYSHCFYHYQQLKLRQMFSKLFNSKLPISFSSKTRS